MSAPQPTPGPDRHGQLERELAHAEDVYDERAASMIRRELRQLEDRDAFELLSAECERLRAERDALRAAAVAALEASVCLKQGRILSCMIDPDACDCFRCKAANQLRAALNQ